MESLRIRAETEKTDEMMNGEKNHDMVTNKQSGVLDKWTAAKIGCDDSGKNLCGENLFGQDLRRALDEYTEKRLWDTLSYAVENSSFYRQRYGDWYIEFKKFFNQDFEAFGNFRLDVGTFAELPFTTPDDLRECEMELLCVKPGDISRIVTLDTGGSTGRPKRIYFTEEDQQLTVDFFENGMQLMADSSDKVLILMPAKIPGSIGRLLSQGIRNFGAQTIEYGLPDMRPVESMDLRSSSSSKHSTENTGCEQQKQQNLDEAEKILELIIKEEVTGIVALPTHMAMLAETERIGNSPFELLDTAPCNQSGVLCDRQKSVCDVNDGSEYHRQSSATSLKWVLLSAEYVSAAQAEKISDTFNCKVYEHYGMTEMGLGCAVSCGYGEGYHVRESDLYIEIIDPKTGRAAAEGETGEIVFTTLNRKGMPFIRYRTGDYSRWITEKCSCGSILKRLDKVEPRDVVKGYLTSRSKKSQR